MRDNAIIFILIAYIESRCTAPLTSAILMEYELVESASDFPRSESEGRK